MKDLSTPDETIAVLYGDADVPTVYEVASKNKRIVNTIIDGLGIFALAFGIGFVSVFFVAPIWLDNTPQLVLSIGLTMLYFVPQEAIFGRTLGKLVTGTKVVTVDDQKPTLPKILLRTAIRLIPFEWVTFVIDKTGKDGWHDKWADTKVVQLK